MIVRSWAVAGNTVGLWFTEGSRIYYTEANPGDNDNDVVWSNSDGLSNPFLVDDDNDEELQTFELFTVRSCTCDTLEGAMVFWTKTFEGSTVDARLQVQGVGQRELTQHFPRPGWRLPKRAEV